MGGLRFARGALDTRALDLRRLDTGALDARKPRCGYHRAECLDIHRAPYRHRPRTGIFTG